MRFALAGGGTGGHAYPSITVGAALRDQVRDGTGRVIDAEGDVGGYPPVGPATRRPFVPAEWDLDTMEPRRTGQP